MSKLRQFSNLLALLYLKVTTKMHKYEHHNTLEIISGVTGVTDSKGLGRGFELTSEKFHLEFENSVKELNS